jgi:hypothetical protein
LLTGRDLRSLGLSLSDEVRQVGVGYGLNSHGLPTIETTRSAGDGTLETTP